MPIAQDILDRFRALWLAEGVPEPMGASEEAILAAEERLGVRMPDELREFYRQFGEVRLTNRSWEGDFVMTDTFLRFHRLNECVLLTEELRDRHPLIAGTEELLYEPQLFVVVADFLLNSYYYAVRCGPGGTERAVGEVVIDNGYKIFETTSTFEEFLRGCLDDPLSVWVTM